ncbi:uncharacterized protein LAESUDRAFT_653521 [Laetiporus sulphureus 93-53]|uniref:Thioesterase domain-containing protein n=1 Tax=Laetiporus sulphureus 93-53 TaxID=1314785 RepID=A0A165E8V2_9APHY|nr:uncharacterized protein LAESUDRAFT_653521 [Laetiporus sulphureus 93-53]KZT06487.1 hypothetical protein LAESUDRAFT_653521 [Laetiporus sulphureus 93-53]
MRLLPAFTREGDFADTVITNLKAIELTIFDRPQDGKQQTRVVFELTVNNDMLNAFDMMHGGCIAFLVDVCSSVALSLLGIVTNGNVAYVSQALNTTYFAGAPLGAKLQIISTTTSVGSRIAIAETEIWDMTDRRLVASGIHTKMKPSRDAIKFARL